MVMIYIASVLAAAYLFLQLFYVWYWKKTPEIVVPAALIPTLKISVVVVAHNEENSIGACIEGIVKQQYPHDLFEIIVIDDRSSDRTIEEIKKTQSPLVRIIKLTDYPECIHPPAYKKSAIELAVRMATHDWIVVTDADCTHPSEWLRTISYAQSKTDAVFLAAPIRYSPGTSLLEKMQEMEMSVLMLITAAGIKSGLHDMANGANMSFSKKAFLDVNGYEGNYQYSSGDDMFLIEKMRSTFPDKIAFVKSKNAVVETRSHKDWNSLIKQRIRWAGKNRGLHNPLINTIWTFIGIYYVLILVSMFIALLHLASWWSFFILILVKWLADGAFIYHSSQFLQKKFSFINFIPHQMMYSFYVFRLGWNILLRRKGDW